MQSFLTACGLATPLQLVVEGPSGDGGELRLLHQPFALIGRDSCADMVLDHGRVSRRHLYIQAIEGRAFWVDLESRTGTRIDGEVRKFGWLLKGGQTLCVGPFLIRPVVGDAGSVHDSSKGKSLPVAPFVATTYSDEALPEVALEFLNGPSQAIAWPVRRVMSLLGSATGCKFRLTDPSVSRFHASFLRTSGGLWVVDLLGQGGIAVNEVPVRFSQLVDGDLLSIGRYQIRVRCRLERQGSGNRQSNGAELKALGQRSRRDVVINGFKSPDWAESMMPIVAGTELAKSVQFPLAIPALSSHSESDVTFPVKLAPSEFSESLLVPLVNQFGVIQQQMFDQFQQAMAMMLEMFGTMHREQMELIRGELDQLHNLTEEFHSLKDELANRTQEQGTLALNPPAAGSNSREEPLATGPSTLETTDTSLEPNILRHVHETITWVSQPSSLGFVVPDHQSSSSGPTESSSPQPPKEPPLSTVSSEKCGLPLRFPPRSRPMVARTLQPLRNETPSCGYISES